MKNHPLPYFSSRNGVKIDAIVLHCSNQDTEEMIKTLEDLNLSSHYIIGYNGEITKLVEESEKAWHAGISYWNGNENLNFNSIGIELSNQTLGQTPYNEPQIEKLIHFLKKLIRKYNIEPQNIVGHSDIAPTRKPDPGLAFPWKKLARNGIGLWYEPKNADKIGENDVAKLLSIIGYNTETEEDTIASAYAFRRRFLPEEVKIDEDVMHLVDNVYPTGDKSLLEGEKFLKTLKAVAYEFNKTKKED